MPVANMTVTVDHVCGFNLNFTCIFSLNDKDRSPVKTASKLRVGNSLCCAANLNRSLKSNICLSFFTVLFIPKDKWKHIPIEAASEPIYRTSVG